MSSRREHFRVGEIRCVALKDGTYSYPTNWIFSNVAQAEVEERLRERSLPTTHIQSPYTCLLVRDGKNVVLIDTGAAALAPTTGDLPRQLAAEGVKPEEVTHVVLTHGHPDHIGAVLDVNGKPAFANARYVMSRAEFEFWTRDPDLHGAAIDNQMKQMLVSVAKKNLIPLKEQMDLVDGEREIVPGVQIIPAPGHTPGHVGVLVTSAKTHLLHVSDAVLHPLNMEYPAWRNVFDLDEELAAQTRQRFFDRAASDKIKVLAYHFPFPGLGYVETHGHVWKWRAENR
jgi:glyoxylase-like metal-dependent hydrolase (beta-lactamase superfamily II)